MISSFMIFFHLYLLLRAKQEMSTWAELKMTMNNREKKLKEDKKEKRQEIDLAVLFTDKNR